MGPLKIVVPNLVQVRNMVPKLGSGKVTYKISKMPLYSFEDTSPKKRPQF